jgi:hypothetical protein
MKLIVLKKFRDKEDAKKVYAPGQEVTHFDKERAGDVIKRGLCKKVVEEDKGKAVVADKKPETATDVDMADNWKAIVSAIGKVSDVEKLKGHLDSEKARKEPRASVVKALEDRIAELSEAF